MATPSLLQQPICRMGFWQGRDDYIGLQELLLGIGLKGSVFFLEAKRRVHYSVQRRVSGLAGSSQ
ncbi:MAG: hypothetical protein HKL95_04055 [Phycisphaerae bacterium]|nr:hypothetical protein [Phycisphaerae bacterium]